MTRRLPSEPVVAVVGATGLVGEVLLSVLQERGFPAAEVRALAGPGAPGRSVRFRGEELPVRPSSVEDLDGVDLVFFAATGELSRTLAPAAVERGAIVIDKSGTWRLEPDVPLVVPEVDTGALERHRGLIACPNCTTIGLVLALEPLRRAAGLERVVVTTLQAASGAGRAALEELEAQERAREAGGAPPTDVLGLLHRNVLPICDGLEADGTTGEERKLLLETRKILSEPDLDLAATCLRVPVPVGHLASVWVRTRRDLDPAAAARAWEAFPGVRLVEEPTPAGVAGTDQCHVGRVRVPPGSGGLLFLQVADNLRKGAATNAVQIAELLLP